MNCYSTLKNRYLSKLLRGFHFSLSEIIQDDKKKRYTICLTYVRKWVSKLQCNFKTHFLLYCRNGLSERNFTETCFLPEGFTETCFSNGVLMRRVFFSRRFIEPCFFHSVLIRRFFNTIFIRLYLFAVIKIYYYEIKKVDTMCI